MVHLQIGPSLLLLQRFLHHHHHQVPRLWWRHLKPHSLLKLLQASAHHLRSLQLELQGLLHRTFLLPSLKYLLKPRLFLKPAAPVKSAAPVMPAEPAGPPPKGKDKGSGKGKGKSKPPGELVNIGRGFLVDPGTFQRVDLTASTSQQVVSSILAIDFHNVLDRTFIRQGRRTVVEQQEYPHQRPALLPAVVAWLTRVARVCNEQKVLLVLCSHIGERSEAIESHALSVLRNSTQDSSSDLFDVWIITRFRTEQEANCGAFKRSFRGAGQSPSSTITSPSFANSRVPTSGASILDSRKGRALGLAPTTTSTTLQLTWKGGSWRTGATLESANHMEFPERD